MIDISRDSPLPSWVRYSLATGASLVVAAAVLVANWDERYAIGISSWNTTQWNTQFGWPLICCRRQVSEPDVPPPAPPWDQRRVLSSSFRWPHSCVNAAVGIALTVGTALTVHHSTRRGPLPRFGLRTLLAGITVASVLLAIVRYERSVDVYFLALLGSGETDYYPATLFAWWIYVPLFFGMACTLHVAGRLLIGIARPIFNLAGRKPHHPDRLQPRP